MIQDCWSFKVSNFLFIWNIVCLTNSLRFGWTILPCWVLFGGTVQLSPKKEGDLNCEDDLGTKDELKNWDSHKNELPQKGRPSQKGRQT